MEVCPKRWLIYFLTLDLTNTLFLKVLLFILSSPSFSYFLPFFIFVFLFFCSSNVGVCLIVSIKGFWSVNQRKFFENYAKQNKFDPLIAENWYSQPRRKIMVMKVHY